MDQIFTSTHWRGATRRILINNERILYMERGQGEKVVYTVRFDNGETLDLDEGTGEALEHELQQLQRPSPPVQYVSAEPGRSPRLPRRFRASTPTS